MMVFCWLIIVGSSLILVEYLEGKSKVVLVLWKVVINFFNFLVWDEFLLIRWELVVFGNCIELFGIVCVSFR